MGSGCKPACRSNCPESYVHLRPPLTDLAHPRLSRAGAFQGTVSQVELLRANGFVGISRRSRFSWPFQQPGGLYGTTKRVTSLLGNHYTTECADAFRASHCRLGVGGERVGTHQTIGSASLYAEDKVRLTSVFHAITIATLYHSKGCRSVRI